MIKTRSFGDVFFLFFFYPIAYLLYRNQPYKVKFKDTKLA